MFEEDERLQQQPDPQTGAEGGVNEDAVNKQTGGDSSIPEFAPPSPGISQVSAPVPSQPRKRVDEPDDIFSEVDPAPPSPEKYPHLPSSEFGAERKAQSAPADAEIPKEMVNPEGVTPRTSPVLRQAVLKRMSAAGASQDAQEKQAAVLSSSKGAQGGVETKPPFLKSKSFYLTLSFVVGLVVLAGAGYLLASFFLTVSSEQNSAADTEISPAVPSGPDARVAPSPGAGPTASPSPQAAPESSPSPPLDSDHDGLTDEEELRYGTNPNRVDTDGDGLYDRDEVKVFKTDPLNPDTDGDGFLDGEEVKNRYNPKGPGRFPGPQQ